MSEISVPSSVEQFILRDAVSRIRRQPFGEQPEPPPLLLPNADVAVIKVPLDGIPACTLEEFDSDGNEGKYQLGTALCEIMYLYLKNEQAYVNDPIVDNLKVQANVIAPPNPTDQTKNHSEWIHNPYQWKHYGSYTTKSTTMQDGKNPTFFTIAIRERTGLWICNRPADILKAKAAEVLHPGSAGNVTVWVGGKSTGLKEIAYLNWMHGNQQISSGKELLIRFFEDERRWVVIGAECESS